jgi:cytochrome c
MNAFEWNKVIGAGLMALLVTTVIGHLGNILVHPKRLDKNVYVVEGVAEAKPEAAAGAAPAQVEPIAPLLASAKAEDGQKVSRQCAACHTFDKGGKSGVGPNLYGVVGGHTAHLEGFAYSPAMKAKNSEWDYEALNQFLANPKGFVPGTKMAFAGLRKPEDRAAIIAYLRTLSDNPKPLP